MAGTALSFHSIAVDAHDLPSLARFWCAVLDRQVLHEADDEIVIGADASTVPGVTFVPVAEGKTVKNRLHIDLAPDDRAAEVERVVGLGARWVDIGQGADVRRVVLADPEGNEFCVLTPKNSLID
ncbi:VOC family protein [Streptomyces sp. NPDC056061]|uniref:VOC family protein n=1 Tax=Streptomyces sp. NPDC056061 TaxID=3345700 RepID=UPI0035E1E1BE